MELIKGKDRRIHVTTPQAWGYTVGTDFWAVFNNSGQLTVGNAHELSDYGWTTTGLGLDPGGTADFLSSADVNYASRVTLADASDVLNSPAMFGSWSEAQIAATILGYTPTRLCLEAYALFPATGGNETATGFGFIQAGGSPITAANALAFIHLDATNFAIRSSADTDASAIAKDANPHKFKIVLTKGASATDAVEWFIDDVSAGTIDLVQDVWPAHFGAGVVAAGVNDIALHWVHIWYE